VLKKRKKNNVPMVAEMLAKAAKKEREHREKKEEAKDDMGDVSKDQSPRESPWRSVSEGYTQDKTPNYSNIKTEMNIEEEEE